jgi:hypothetical protein
MKTIAEQYRETLERARKCKPRSERKTLLTRKLRDLMTRRLRAELRKKAA